MYVIKHKELELYVAKLYGTRYYAVSDINKAKIWRRRPHSSAGYANRLPSLNIDYCWNSRHGTVQGNFEIREVKLIL